MYEGPLPPFSNRESFELSFQVNDSETGDLVALDDAMIVFEIQRKSGGTILSATTANGKVTIPSTGVFQVNFTTSEMRQLCEKQYDVGCTISSDGDTENNTEQFLIGTLPILGGNVS